MEKIEVRVLAHPQLTLGGPSISSLMYQKWR